MEVGIDGGMVDDGGFYDDGRMIKSLMKEVVTSFDLMVSGAREVR